MSNVVPFARKEQEPAQPDNHLKGEAVCAACAHWWVAVQPVGGSTELECPRCHAQRGVFKHFVEYDRPRWSCTTCTGFLFTAILVDDTPCIACANCGELTNAIDLFNK